MNFIQRLIGKQALPEFLKEMVERKLGKKIVSFELVSPGPELISYLLLTNEDCVDFHAWVNKARWETERAVLDLCRRQKIPVPKILLEGKNEINDQVYQFLIEGIKGEPLNSQRIHLFDYNRVLDQVAKVLLKLHTIGLEGFGPLEPSLRGRRGSWSAFLAQDLAVQLEILHKEKIFKGSVIKTMSEIFNCASAKVIPVLLHGQLSTAVIYVDRNLNVCCLSNFTQALSGDPNYEMAGFLIYEGFDRTKRLMRAYQSFGGLTAWDSPEFLRLCLRRVISLLFWKVKTKQSETTGPLKQTALEIIHRYQAS